MEAVNPISAHREGADYNDPEVRRIKRLSAPMMTYAVSFLDWRTKETATEGEQEALTTLHRACIAAAGQNKPTRETVVGWSKDNPEYAFFHQEADGAEVEEFVAGELVAA